MHTASAILCVVLVPCTVGMIGCGKQEVPASAVAPQSAEAKVEPESVAPTPQAAEMGTVKIEFDVPVDPKAIVSISGNEYSPADLEQPLALKPGNYTVAVKQTGRELPPQRFSVEKGQRRIVRIFDPQRRAAEWALRSKGIVRIMVDGQQQEIRNLADLPQTEFTVVLIGLGSTKIEDSQLEHLQGLSQLKHLGLHDTPITDLGLVHLHGLTELVGLDLKRTKITDAGLEKLKGLTKLANLELSSVPITDAGLVHLKNLPALDLLYLTGSKVTDAAASDLQQLTGLVYLHLENTRITDACLAPLKQLKKLRYLGLEGTQVTEAGAADFKAALPQCEVKL